MSTKYGFVRNRVSRPALSAGLLICSAVWFVGAGVGFATGGFKTDWPGTPLFWLLIIMVTPAICFALAVELLNTQQQSPFSGLDRYALAAAFFPVTLGSLLAVWAVKVLFWASFQDASVALRTFGALASLALVAISGTMIWKTTRNYRLSKQKVIL